MKRARIAAFGGNADSFPLLLNYHTPQEKNIVKVAFGARLEP
jgi:hypothetical protein